MRPVPRGRLSYRVNFLCIMIQTIILTAGGFKYDKWLNQRGHADPPGADIVRAFLLFSRRLLPDPLNLDIPGKNYKKYIKAARGPDDT